MTQAKQASNGKAVLVTGCSSGIGRATAVYLAEQGYTVFATVRKEADAANLRGLNLPTLVPVCPLDLTRPEDIASAVAAVERELSARRLELFALVSNAGGGGVAPLELMDVDKFRAEVETRIVAPVALLQAFLPDIRRAHGRVVWIATPSIIPIAYVASIHACDFAVNCLARTLQIELKQWSISSIMVRCGGVKTASAERSVQELEASFAQWPPERFAPYAEALRKEAKELSAFDANRTEPQEIAQVVYKALSVRKPKRRYQVGYLSGLAAALEYLPQTWVDAIMERRG
jgi:NAD(P)-dependent dehydrogenase (short-subunit alcohol dehydrogenase family)